MGRITLYGFYQYDKTLFDDILLPDGLEKNILVSDIMRYSGELYTYYQVPAMLKNNITNWFARRLFDFNKIYDALRSEYSPIENYNRKEDIQRNYQDSGTDTETITLGSKTSMSTTSRGEDSITVERSNEKSVSAYNTSEYANREKDSEDSISGNTSSNSMLSSNERSGSDSTKTDYGKHRSETENTHIHGNIGITTNQDMVSSEVELRLKYDMYSLIAAQFEREFLVQVY